MKRFVWAGSLIMGLVLSMILVYGYYETFQVKITHVTLHDPVFAEVLHGKTLVHLSDLHMKGMGFREKKVLAILENLKPDILVLTGDYIGWGGKADSAMELLAKARASLGVYAVMGDYDYSVSRQSCQFCHRQGNRERTDTHKVHMLKNNAETLQVNGRTLTFLGLDEGDRDTDLSGLVKRMSFEVPLIVLGHSPLLFDDFDKKIPLLMLAGDTHGGQIPLPSLFWNLLGYTKNVKYNRGLFREGRKMMYVSRGIGTSHVPIRLFCPPEIVVYHF